ncbi:MAG: dihydropyrimidinase [Phycisphaerae bacterium]|nr:dihydropyrimidinase [Phycisphaerae bacterium]
MPTPPLLVTNGRIVTASEDFRGDVLAVDGVVERIERRIDPASAPRGATVVDAKDKFVFPGFIDPHVHVHLPFMGTHAKDTWESASQAALVGGTTTLIEMICPGKQDDPLEAFETWLSKANAGAACDYSFHMGVTRFDGAAERALREIVRRGITSFKVFLAYKGALGVDDRELFAAMRLARELGVVVTAHCENETLVDEAQRSLVSAGRTGPEWHEPSRPPRVEAAGVHHLMAFAEATGAEVYVVHTSCDEAVREALAGIGRGVHAHVEVVIPHLVLDRSYAERPGFEGAKFVMSPPLRDASQPPRLWNWLRAGVIETVATDHAPFDFETQKHMGRDDFTRIPNGIPSVEDRVNLLWTHGVCAGRIDLHTFVASASANAARIFGLKGKGSIAVGGDADLVIYDPKFRGRITAANHRMATDYSAFEGWELKGRASVVVRRGEIVAKDGRFVGPGGGGRLVPRA